MRIRLLPVVVVALSAALLAAAPAGAVPRAAAADVKRGVVDVSTDLAYQGAAAAGTGIVLTPSGYVLTNNHVIRGATTIHVTEVSTGRTYPATVVGYSVSSDVALLRLRGASGLKTAAFGSSARARVGDAVTAVGNAGGTGGAWISRGKVTKLKTAITAGDDRGSSTRLVGLIETSAALEPGDSGGPLLDAAGRVIGINAAASRSFDFNATRSRAYAVPIDRALAIARQIRAGRGSAAVHVGPTAFIGVSVASRFDDPSSGAVVRAVVPSSPAERVGLQPGDVIVSVAGRPVGSPTALTAAMLRLSPGTSVKIRWTDESGATHTGTLRPIAGPPQ
jgi:S1-C subfamily serine protease